MENSTRLATLNHLKETVIFWAMQVRLAEKALREAPAGMKDVAKRRLYHVKTRFNETVDTYQGKLP